MALIKEPYGLVYNTDGTLCTTYRDDDVPFRGVRSFAVETATENLIQNPQFATGDFTSWSVHFPEYFELDEGHKARYSVKSLPNDTTSFRSLRQTFNTVVGQQYTISFWIKHSTEVTSSFRFYIYLKSALAPSYGNIQTISSSFFDGQWHKLTYTFTAQYDSYYISVESAPNKLDGYSWITDIQVEQKPFASSFVVGSRPSGRFVILVEDLKFDIANDDWVISYWKYPVATDEDNLNGYNSCSLGRWTSGLSKGYIYWGKTHSANKYYLTVVLNDATFFRNTSNNTFNPTDYFYHWHYEVMKKQGKTFSYYVDGVKQCETVISADKELQTPFDVGLSLEGFIENNAFYPNNALIAAPYYGYNSATWTDEYIREVYEAKIPYPAQNKLSIY